MSNNYSTPIRCFNRNEGSQARICDFETDGDKEFLVFKDKQSQTKKRIALSDFNRQVEQAKKNARN